MQDTISLCLMLIPALPLAAAVLIGALGPRLLKNYSHLPLILALAGSCVCALALYREVGLEQAKSGAQSIAGFEKVITLWTWADIPDAYDLRGTGATAADSGPRAFRLDIALRADALTAMMLAMVTFISTLVAVFAAGYMEGDRGYWRFFAYMGLFVFSMTMLVSVSNFALLFVFWEAVGVCSYLLIGFWYTKPEAAAAGVKAFLVNRVGDFGFALALFLIWCTYGTLNYHDSLPDGSVDAAALEAASSNATAGSPSDAAPAGPALIRGVLGQRRIAAGDYVTGGIATAICLLLLIGACGKSAQFPLHVWLPDAMEGPTPVSALIHAATMVTAGVYMVTRCTPLFAVSPTAQLVVACIGAFTALLAGLIALTQFDLKRVLAYSTISQLGYMFLALGVGTFAGVTSGMYHLFTHAFFKALLFLGAGSVMHAMGGVIDMRQFGGLRRLMPHTHWTFLFGCLALAGIFPFAGFWSKDAIFASLHDKIHELDHEIEHRDEHSHAPAVGQHEGAATHGTSADLHPSPLPKGDGTSPPGPLAKWSDSQLATSRAVYQWLYYSALLTAFLTAFYTFRAFSLTFYGDEVIPHEAGHHAHESPPLMVMPLGVLAVCALLVGILAISNPTNWGTNRLVDFLAGTPSLAAGEIALTKVPEQFHLPIAGISTVVAVAGMGLALYMYLGDRSEARFLQRVFDLQGLNRLTDPQWVLGLERVWWIGATTRFLRRNHLGWLVTLVGYVLAILSLILAAPLLVGNFVTPYKLSLRKFYFDELYAALFVWPLQLAAQIAFWIDRWLVDGLVNLVGRVPPAVGSLMRSLQMGLVQFYALAMVLGSLILIAARLYYAAG
ncbi:MAG: NADH-quinone oxidoreductase subunit L [Pirellulaceae bacterium]|nr:NADH-quinone oxidoreductase subunit L [Pirellulaceae bacterium]